MQVIWTYWRITLHYWLISIFEVKKRAHSICVLVFLCLQVAVQGQVQGQKGQGQKSGRDSSFYEWTTTQHNALQITNPFLQVQERSQVVRAGVFTNWGLTLHGEFGTAMQKVIAKVDSQWYGQGRSDLTYGTARLGWQGESWHGQGLLTIHEYTSLYPELLKALTVLQNSDLWMGGYGVQAGWSNKANGMGFVAKYTHFAPELGAVTLWNQAFQDYEKDTLQIVAIHEQRQLQVLGAYRLGGFELGHMLGVEWYPMRSMQDSLLTIQDSGWGMHALLHARWDRLSGQLVTKHKNVTTQGLRWNGNGGVKRYHFAQVQYGKYGLALGVLKKPNPIHSLVTPVQSTPSQNWFMRVYWDVYTARTTQPNNPIQQRKETINYNRLFDADLFTIISSSVLRSGWQLDGSAWGHHVRVTPPAAAFGLSLGAWRYTMGVQCDGGVVTAEASLVAGAQSRSWLGVQDSKTQYDAFAQAVYVQPKLEWQVEGTIKNSHPKLLMTVSQIFPIHFSYDFGAQNEESDLHTSKVSTPKALQNGFEISLLASLGF
jgi:hypothetical protein